MADEQDNETPETPEAETPEAEAPAEEAAAAEETAAAEAPAAEEAPVVEEETPAAETPEAETPAAEETPVAETPEAEAPAISEATATPVAAPAEPAEQLSSKERRRTARSTHSGEARPARSSEERHAERLAERRAKAVARRARRLQERVKRTAKRQSGAATPTEQLAPVHAPVEGRRSVRQGVVVSDKADKTITVRIDFARRHRRYEKIVRSSSTLHAHDEQNDAHEGDTVRVIESRPLSKNKRWKLVDVLERAR
jgi:small subunit ribosomal protein S17